MGAARTAVAGPLTAPAGAEPAESSPAPRRRWWSIGVAVDWFFFVFAGLAAVWLAYLSLTETFHVGWWGIPFFLGFWALLAYLVLPRLHRIDHIVATVTAGDPRVTLDVIRDFSTGYHARNGGGDSIRTDGDLPVVDVRALAGVSA